MNVALLLLAAGSGVRMGGEEGKVFRCWRGKELLWHALVPFAETGLFFQAVIVLPEEAEKRARRVLSGLPGGLHCDFVAGGSTRQKSVTRGLEFLAEEGKARWVHIHDGVRPWVSSELIKRVHRRALESDAAIPVVPLVDAIKRVEGEWVTEHLSRSSFSLAQTPQAFSLQQLLRAHRLAEQEGESFDDDAAVWSRYIGASGVVEGDPHNTKVTYDHDLERP